MSSGRSRSIPDEDRDKLIKRISGYDPKQKKKDTYGSPYDQLLRKRSPSVPCVSDEECQSRSIEIFFGSLTDFNNFYDALSEEGYLTPTVSPSQKMSPPTFQNPGPASQKTRVNPQGVKKLVLVGHPLNSFSGIGKFKSLVETWVTNCGITEIKSSDFEGLKNLNRLFLFSCNLRKIEPLYLENLRVLWISRNNLTSLNFLTAGLHCLSELNVAENFITCLKEEELYQCLCLENLNVSGNPLCSLQDIKAVNVLPCLKGLWLMDPMYGKCPVACICDSRSMLVSSLTYVTNLNGSKISAEEYKEVKDYVEQRRIYYYGSAMVAMSAHHTVRAAAVAKVYRQLTYISQRILKLKIIAAQYEKALFQIDYSPELFDFKQKVNTEVKKVYKRLEELKKWFRVSICRFDLMMQISRWEQKMEEWTKWIEFFTFGSTQCYISHSVLDSNEKDEEDIRGTIYELISSLSCTKQPSNVMIKVDTIIPIIDKGLEAGMERTFEQYFAVRNQPDFVPPPPPDSRPTTPATSRYQSPYFPASSVIPQVHRQVVPSYMPTNYVLPEPLFPFPESVEGLPERSQPVFMYLLCPKVRTGNPMDYITKFLTQKARHYDEIRLTNCLWLACQINLQKQPKELLGLFSVLMIVKVLENCLQPVPNEANSRDEDGSKSHGGECFIFSVNKPLAVTPAYIVSLSYAYKDINSLWYNGEYDDNELLNPANDVLGEMTRMLNLLSPKSVTDVSKRPNNNHSLQFFLKRNSDGVTANFSAVKVLDKETKDSKAESSSIQIKSGIDLNQIGQSLGLDIAFSMTSLNVSGNWLSSTKGLYGLTNLKKLDISHNNLTTLSGLQKMPGLVELHAKHNFLRFFHSNLATLGNIAPRLTSLEILPNPFQDVRNISHIPILAAQVLPLIEKVDIWRAPFVYTTTLKEFCPRLNNETGFAHTVLMSNPSSRASKYDHFSGKCLTTLEMMPLSPPTCENLGIDLDLSDNYLSSIALSCAPFAQTMEWRNTLVEIQLQENVVTNLEWMKEKSFSSLKILNLSDNKLSDLEGIGPACPALCHLHLSGNPLPASTVVLCPLKELKKLISLDATRTPLSCHQEYSNFVSKHLRNVQVLDGTAIAAWQTEEIADRIGGTLSCDWLEANLGHQNWYKLTQLSLPNCGLQKINLPATSLPHLLSLDLKGNHLSNLSGLSGLPNLRVLCVSHNNICSLGETPCPTCFSYTVESQSQLGLGTKNFISSINFPNLQPIESSASKVSMDRIFMDWDSQGIETDFNANNVYNNDSRASLPETSRKTSSGSNFSLGSYTQPTPRQSNHSSKPRIHASVVFPNLEVLIMSHNCLGGVADLHFHAMPSLQTLVLNCNELTGVQGIENIPSLQVIVLDNNNIRDVPFNSLHGCKALRYLHLEHNRITAIPRLPHLTNLVALYLAHNRIQTLTDVDCLGTTGITEMTLNGNPAACRVDYQKTVVNKLPNLSFLDGMENLDEKIRAAMKSSSRCNIHYDIDERDCVHQVSSFQLERGLRVCSKSINGHNADLSSMSRSYKGISLN